MLLWVRLLHIALRHLLHHKVSINFHILDKFSILNTPLPGNGQDTDWGLGVHERVDAVLDVRKSKLIGRLYGHVSG